ncbi:MAG: hypothetical protein HRU22_14375 [Gammaproteobacteria bacterium]|nr:hypothetical protein [Gammaproteobacteria bacterium]
MNVADMNFFERTWTLANGSDTSGATSNGIIYENFLLRGLSHVSAVKIG